MSGAFSRCYLFSSLFLYRCKVLRSTDACMFPGSSRYLGLKLAVNVHRRKEWLLCPQRIAAANTKWSAGAANCRQRSVLVASPRGTGCASAENQQPWPSTDTTGHNAAPPVRIVLRFFPLLRSISFPFIVRGCPSSETFPRFSRFSS